MITKTDFNTVGVMMKPNPKVVSIATTPGMHAGHFKTSKAEPPVPSNALNPFFFFRMNPF